VFHLELRQFPHLARSFNLTREELDRRFLGPWAEGHAVQLDDHRFTPGRARLTIYEGPRLGPEEIGLGRGWANVTRTGQDVSAQLLVQAQQPAPPAELEQLKHELLERVAASPLSAAAVIEELAGRHPGWRASERLALAERAIWELLHEQRLRLSVDGAAVAREQWQPVLLAWETWTEARVWLVP